MLSRSAGLSAATLEAIAALEQRVLAVDGGRLKLEWSTLQSRPGDRVDDVLWRDADQLLGFCGVYQFGGAVPEITGMVDPIARRQGIGGRLLDAAADICRTRGSDTALLVVPRGSTGGRELALRRGGRLHHSEHALVLDGEPVAGPSDPATTLRPASPADAADVAAVRDLLQSGFGVTPDHLPVEVSEPSRAERTLVVEREGRVIGTVRISHDRTDAGDVGGIYGFVVAAAERGRGIGRDVLRRCCRLLRDEGATRVGLEVEVDNQHALGLYTSTGFVPMTTEDYYALDW